MLPSHDTLVFVAKTFGLFYLVALSLIFLVHTLRPSMRARYERAARSIFDGEDRP